MSGGGTLGGGRLTSHECLLLCSGAINISSVQTFSQEAEWFQNPDLPERKQHWQRLVEKKTAGIADLVPRVQKMYLAHLQSFWKDRKLLEGDLLHAPFSKIMSSLDKDLAFS